MARFLPPEAFSAATDALSLLPFNLERSGTNQYLVSNMVGDFIRLTDAELNKLVDLQLRPGDGLYEKAYAAHLVTGANQIAQRQLLALRLRSRMSFLRHLTPLHIFVVTLRCEHSCPYCQVSRQSTDRSRFDMSEQTAERALDVAFAGPSARIKIEFQGGEPLLNFLLIKTIVSAAKARSIAVGKRVDFVIASNLALLDDAVLEFCKSNDVLLSTSLDGPADLHNKNRPRPGGNSHELAVAGIRRARGTLGQDRVGALMTTTEASLDRVDDIIDEYLRLGLDGIFLRPLSPFGFAVKTKQYQKYDAQKWLEFYERGLRRVLEINRQGTPFREFYAALILTRMLSDRPIGYVDLRSPAGVGLGALVYNYDGSVFASDEGRMLAETGDDAFRLGHVDRDSYQSLILSDKLIDAVSSSLTQCAPECSTCVYESHCGADPVYHHATQGDALGIKPLSAFCARQKGIMGLLLEILDNSPEDAAILRRGLAMTLPLYGKATASAGFDVRKARSAIRIRSIESTAERHPSDFALVRTSDQLERAVAAKWESVFVVSDGPVQEQFAGFDGRLVAVTSKYDYLQNGDVLGLDHLSGKFRTLFRRNSAHNSFLVTERCNNYCLMCSQPPKDVDDRWLLAEIKESLALIDPTTRALTFTGGETLSDWADFVDVLKTCRDLLPATALQVLTNGRAFANSSIVDAWRDVRHPNLMAAIPVYASVDHIHDFVVQAKGAFDETILGILKLKDRGQRVEIRIVLHALTAPIVAETCRWIARNLPFVDHVALMGLENTGFAIANDTLLWIDPVDYRDALAEAVDHLVAAGVNVSVYNLPKCVLSRSVWPYALQSISDWKNGFVAECDRCDEKTNCSGFFTTGRPRFSRGVNAITSEQHVHSGATSGA